MSGVRRDVVQVLNPRTGRYTRIDRAAGTLKAKRTPGPWKNVPLLVVYDPDEHAWPTAYEIALGYLRQNPRLADILDLLGLTFGDYVRAIAARMPPETYASACTASRPV